jgi:hypothetical protein
MLLVGASGGVVYACAGTNGTGALPTSIGTKKSDGLVYGSTALFSSFL